MRVVPLLLWLVMESGRSSRAVARQFLIWVAHVLERGPFWDRGTTDALVAAPVPRGAKRARRLDAALAEAVAAAAAKREGGRTSGQVLKHVQRFRAWRGTGPNAKRLCQREETRLCRYRALAREVFAPERCHTVSVALDATRLSGKDMLFLAMCSPQASQATWCPPQVPLFVSLGLFLLVLLLPFCARCCPFPFVFCRVVFVCFCPFSPRTVQNSFAVYCFVGAHQVLPDMPVGAWAAGERGDAQDHEDWVLQQLDSFPGRRSQRGKGSGGGRPRTNAKPSPKKGSTRTPS